MGEEQNQKLIEKPEFRDQTNCFKNRNDAGKLLAKMLRAFHGTNSTIFAIPNGGLEIAAIVAKALQLPLDLAIVNKITPPWSSTASYGAVAWDSSVLLNESILPAMQLSNEEIHNAIHRTKQTVIERTKKLRGDPLTSDLSRTTAIIIDEGIASGYTMRAAVEAISKLKPAKIIIAVATAQLRTARDLTNICDQLYCVNIQSRWDFAVAEAFRRYSDIPDSEVSRIVDEFLAKPVA